MQCDLLLRNVRLEGCPELVDVAIENQKIARSWPAGQSRGKRNG